MNWDKYTNEEDVGYAQKKKKLFWLCLEFRAFNCMVAILHDIKT